jgi:hypothetical protein
MKVKMEIIEFTFLNDCDVNWVLHIINGIDVIAMFFFTNILPVYQNKYARNRFKKKKEEMNKYRTNESLNRVAWLTINAR